jgi:putative transposase
MPRTARASVGGICYHVINRGNNRARIYHDQSDYRAFVRLVELACQRLPMRVLAYCLMPNHFHFVLWPHHDGDLSRWMHWLLTTHVRRYHRKRGTSGRIWQGRFKAFPIQKDDHLLTVLRYVERNPLRANLVIRAKDWAWSSARWHATRNAPAYLDPGPVQRPENWEIYVHQALTGAERAALHQCIRRNAPYGRTVWVRQTATELGLESSLRGPGRPASNGDIPD